MLKDQILKILSTTPSTTKELDNKIPNFKYASISATITRLKNEKKIFVLEKRGRESVYFRQLVPHSITDRNQEIFSNVYPDYQGDLDILLEMNNLYNHTLPKLLSGKLLHYDLLHYRHSSTPSFEEWKVEAYLQVIFHMLRKFDKPSITSTQNNSESGNCIAYYRTKSPWIFLKETHYGDELAYKWSLERKIPTFVRDELRDGPVFDQKPMNEENEYDIAENTYLGIKGLFFVGKEVLPVLIPNDHEGNRRFQHIRDECFNNTFFTIVKDCRFQLFYLFSTEVLEEGETCVVNNKTWHGIPVDIFTAMCAQFSSKPLYVIREYTQEEKIKEIMPLVLLMDSIDQPKFKGLLQRSDTVSDINELEEIFNRHKLHGIEVSWDKIRGIVHVQGRDDTSLQVQNLFTAADYVNFEIIHEFYPALQTLPKELLKKILNIYNSAHIDVQIIGYSSWTIPQIIDQIISHYDPKELFSLLIHPDQPFASKFQDKINKAVEILAKRNTQEKIHHFQEISPIGYSVKIEGLQWEVHTIVQISDLTQPCTDHYRKCGCKVGQKGGVCKHQIMVYLKLLHERKIEVANIPLPIQRAWLSSFLDLEDLDEFHFLQFDQDLLALNQTLMQEGFPKIKLDGYYSHSLKIQQISSPRWKRGSVCRYMIAYLKGVKFVLELNEAAYDSDVFKKDACIEVEFHVTGFGVDHIWGIIIDP